jgi:ABC-type sugar transport system ATPase subunit
MGLLEVKQLTKKFGNRAVLDNVSFTVDDGEFFVLLGPSGGGKSTILKILCGIESSDAGSVVLAGKDITTSAPRDRNVGMVFQDYGLYPHMNVAENIAYGLEARNYPKDEVAKRVKDAAERLGLTPLIDRVIVDLSGGEQQRVALARALAKDADMYLFDEPISNLDPKLRAQARRDILMVHRAKQKPTVYVTHDQNEALAISDRIAIIAGGRLQQVGTADELLRRPANVFVAGFLDTPAMNLLPGDLKFDSGEYRVNITDALSIRLPAQWNETLKNYNKPRVILGIPPAAFLAPDVAVEADLHGVENHIAGEIDFVEPLVSEVVVSFKLQNNFFVSAIFQGVDETALEVGSKIQVGVDSAQFCLFDPDTEQAL